MKSIYLLLGVLLAASTIYAQTLSQATANPSALPGPTPYTVVAQGANQQVWQSETYEQAPNGKTVPHIHQYTELATGLNHLVNGQWVGSSEQIEISPDGSSASATNGQHQVYFPGNVYSGLIKLVTPDGQTIQSQPIGLSYFDGTNSVLIAAVTNSTGAILPSGNQVIYTNAFDGLNADLLYTYTKAGFEQDIVLREQPPDPVALGLNPATTRMQVLTEFFNPPQPSVTATTVPTAVGNLEDDDLSFGTMAMRRGRAFLVGNNELAAGVTKRWLLIQGRQFLIEEVPIVSIASEIDTLPAFVGQTGSGTKPVVSRNLILPPQRLTDTSPKTTFLAQAMPPTNGLVLDYVTINSSMTNYTFQGDTTYYISGPVNLYGSNTFEGGAVLKYTNNASITVNIAYSGSPTNLPLNWQTSAYRPVIFTAKDDNSVGETLSVSTGTPTNYYANPALQIEVPSTTTLNNPSCFRINYAQEALLLQGPFVLQDAQFVNCENGIQFFDCTISLRNCLFANVQTNLNPIFYSNGLNIQNCTFSSSSNLIFAQDSASQYVVANLTNCILANVSNLTNTHTYSFTYQVNGGNNGFYSSPPFGTATNGSTTYPFQIVGAGNYYLTNGCVFTNAGTANIDPVLLADLEQKTVCPPIAYSNQTFPTNIVLGPQAPRDTNALPDLGYHYDPLDYAFGGCLANSNVTFTAGTAVGWFRTTSGYNGYEGQGLYMHTNAVAAFQGTATAPDYWVRCNTVQEEGANAPWQGGYGPGGLTGGDDDQYNYQIAGSAEVHLSFTRCSMMAGEQGCHFRDDWGYLIVRANHSEFYDGNVGGYIISCYFTNCFMGRMYGGQVAGWPGDQYIMRNCTWIGGGLQFSPYYDPIPISVLDCAFEGTAFTISSYGTGANADYDYNAYTNGAAQLPTGGTHNITNIVSFNWQRSWFGNYYQSTNSPLLYKGDVLASQVGLYHFTIQTNQVPEGTNIVSIGYHYVATDAYGNPLDSNGDGIPDYLEDANGDGIFDAGDLGEWRISPFGLSGTNVLQVFTPLK